MASPQGKFWCFTYNNPPPDLDAFADLIIDYGASYIFFALEVGESGTPHYQGYVEFPKLKRLSQLKKAHAAVHWERRLGSQQQAIDYCKKDEGTEGWLWIEKGTPADTAQGSRTDLKEAINVLQKGGIRAVASELPETFVRTFRGLSALELFMKPPKPVPIVCLAFGPPGTGKSRLFYDNTESDSRWVSTVDGTGLWFDGYARHTDVCIEDFSGRRSHYTLANLLRLLDRYELSVPVKGGFTWWVPERIYITSNYHPGEWYDWSDRRPQYDALKRRIQLVWNFTGPNEHLELTSEHPQWDAFWARDPSVVK